MMPRSRLRRLHAKAERKCEEYTQESGCRANPCMYLYRNKDKAYFKTILRSSGIMKTRKKDGWGSGVSPINGNLYGTFFMANARSRHGELPLRSPFGQKRLRINSASLLANKRLYFADFYKNKSGAKYITLVATSPGTEAFHFCDTHLMEVDMYDNPFLWYDASGTLRVHGQVWIEVFYTENLNIKQLIRSREAQLYDLCDED